MGVTNGERETSVLLGLVLLILVFGSSIMKSCFRDGQNLLMAFQEISQNSDSDSMKMPVTDITKRIFFKVSLILSRCTLHQNTKSNYAQTSHYIERTPHQSNIHTKFSVLSGRSIYCSIVNNTDNQSDLNSSPGS